MAKAAHERPLELELSDFGPIVEAKIDLRPLTVFVGPSNTGKSYLAILIYALHRFLGVDPQLEIGRRLAFRSSPFSTDTMDEFDLSDSALDLLLGWARINSPQFRGQRPSEGKRVTLPEQVAALARPLFERMDGYAEQFDAEIRRCFGVDDFRQLIRRPGTKGAKVILRRHVATEAGLSDPFEFTFSTRGKDPSFTASVPSGAPLQVTDKLATFLWTLHQAVGSLSDPEDSGDDRALRLSLLHALFDAVFTVSVGEAKRPAYYLPAARTGVMHAHGVVVHSLIGGAASSGFRRTKGMPALSGVMADFLEQLISFGDEPRGRRNLNRELARKLEADVLAGSVRMEKSEVEYPRFFYTPQGWKESDALPLMNASSMVSELAPVVLYLRRVVDPGDLLIIEEPESHLHPAMQVAFIRSLAAAVRSGIRVIITTHSEWILEEVANLVSISRLAENRRKGIDGSPLFLRESDVGAWLFSSRKRPRGSKVEEIKLDKESGTFPSGFSRVSEALYNKWAEISNRIEESSVQ